MKKQTIAEMRNIIDDWYDERTDKKFAKGYEIRRITNKVIEIKRVK